ncbi:DUF3311 domain-containing protein [Frankia sp. CcWB3]
MWHDEQGRDTQRGAPANSAAGVPAAPVPATGRPAAGRPARAAARRRRTAAVACLGTPFAALLAVPLYAQDEPRLAGVPFFYWYQLAWVPLSALLTAAAWRLHSRGTAPEGLR